MERARHSSYVGEDNQKALADALDKHVFVVVFIVPSFDAIARALILLFGNRPSKSHYNVMCNY